MKVKQVGNLAVGKYKKKEIVFLIGRGENCKCSDCPVLYGDTCPYDDEMSATNQINHL